MTSNQKHTPEAIPCPSPEVSEGEVQKRVDELTAKIIEGETRSLICLQALAGIDDPEAFMRDMGLWKKLQLYFKEGDPTFSSVAASLELDEAILEHLKGGDA